MQYFSLTQVAIPIYNSFTMEKRETLKQVAVRMSSQMHDDALKASKKIGESFGQFIRNAVGDRLEGLKRRKRPE